MEDDDLEYDITFPSPISAFAELKERDEYAKSEPVVFLLGWLGCTEKYISKYSQIYEQRCITISYTAPKDVAFFRPYRLKEIACKLLDLLEDYSVTENPVFFHIFSNNGSYVYNSVVRVLTSGEFKKYQKVQVKGVVIDSAPGKRRILQGARAFTANMHGVGFFYRYLMLLYMVFYLLYTSVKASLTFFVNRKSKEDNEHFLYENMAEDQSRWPMLFLYSTVDKVIMYYDIEEMIRRRQTLGVHVDSVSWDNSDHVAHLKVDPKNYTQACWDFVDFCLCEQRMNSGEVESESD